MKVFCSLILALLPSAAFAETYHFAACTFAKSGGQWTATSAVDATREAVGGVSVKVAQVSGDGGGYCSLLLGTGDETQADVLLNSATGTGISVSPSCEFRGQVDDSKSEHQILAYGQSFFVDSAPSQRVGIYFASPQETGGADWAKQACNGLARSSWRRGKTMNL